MSSEGDLFTVERHVLEPCALLRNMLFHNDEDGDSEPIKLERVSTRALCKVIDYCRYHWNNPAKPIPQPLKSTRLADVVCPWDLEFVNVEQEVLFELMLAENFLDIKPLLELTCAKVASMIKGKTPDEIRDEFNIVNDFAPGEEATIREENKWCEDL
ncbi:skp1 family protein [Babesia caballi]|uniref:Skp1 family protein n=1 Tax=Babesia caballi TaxID=5871 RepID=A0AAV4M088_BABCB|nr:skp1 family protein [Babesia caballi]